MTAKNNKIIIIKINKNNFYNIVYNFYNHFTILRHLT